MAKKPELDDATRQIAERMLRMPPKPHKEMAGRKKGVANKNRAKKKKNED